MKYIKTLIAALAACATINATAGSVQGDGWSGNTTKFPDDSWTLAPFVTPNSYGLSVGVYTVAYGIWIMQSKVTVQDGAKTVRQTFRSWVYTSPTTDIGEILSLQFKDVVNTNKRYTVEVWMTSPGQTAVSYYGKAVLYGEK